MTILVHPTAQSIEAIQALQAATGLQAYASANGKTAVLCSPRKPARGVGNGQ